MGAARQASAHFCLNAGMWQILCSSNASGLLYRRNRYYDPATGRFTQEDPIGLAGGVNVYGFAAGTQRYSEKSRSAYSLRRYCRWSLGS